VLGPFGIDHVNYDGRDGRELHDLLDSDGLCSTATFFAKPAYGTWRHPRRSAKNAFQLDHVLVPRGDLSRVRDDGPLMASTNKLQWNQIMHLCRSSFALPVIETKQLKWHTDRQIDNKHFIENSIQGHTRGRHPAR
jgi:hypothetical protein